MTGRNESMRKMAEMLGMGNSLFGIDDLIKKAEGDISRENPEITNLKCTLIGEEAKSKNLLVVLETKSNFIQKLDKEIVSLKEAQESLQENISMSEEKANSLKRHNIHLERENASARKAITELMDDNTSLKKDLASSIEKNAEFTSVINGALSLLERVKDGTHQQLLADIEAILKDSLAVDTPSPNVTDTNIADAEVTKPENAGEGTDQLHCNGQPGPPETKE